ncbi:MAG: hypothetical protein RLZZ254_270 [Actinomycetota bacterium]|jgi:glutamate-1-semialdehyde 2,1-aminomutase
MSVFLTTRKVWWQSLAIANNGAMTAVDRRRLSAAMQAERERFIEAHPESRRLAQEAKAQMLSGVPMPWMVRWPGDFPLFLESAEGVSFLDVDGNRYVDFCLGDTGAMTGHGREDVADAISRQARRGLTTMMPTADALWVANELSNRFGKMKWQFCLSATDANRFMLRFARHVTRRKMIVVNDWCYHGTVDEALVILSEDGSTISRPGAIGPQVEPSTTTRAVPFNDLDALDRALSHGDVAVVLMEPALTNIGIVLPEPGYLEGVREITRRHGTLLAIDETHTICAGPGGCTKAWNLEPDFVIIGKTIGGGVPVAAYGIAESVSRVLEDQMHGHDVDVSGVGGTLSGSAFGMAAMRATLANSLQPADFAKAEPLAIRWTEGVRDVVNSRSLDWHVQRLGVRAEYWFSSPPRNGRDAAASVDSELESYFHLAALNRGVLLTPFHNMALLSPLHSSDDVDVHTRIFEESVNAVVTK